MGTIGVGYWENTPVPTGFKCKTVMIGTGNSIELSWQFQ
jgi:hypothetical protein